MKGNAWQVGLRVDGSRKMNSEKIMDMARVFPCHIHL
jgi:hypothetical protein